jgi:hypothetical protein
MPASLCSLSDAVTLTPAVVQVVMAREVASVEKFRLKDVSEEYDASIVVIYMKVAALFCSVTWYSAIRIRYGAVTYRNAM